MSIKLVPKPEHSKLWITFEPNLVLQARLKRLDSVRRLVMEYYQAHGCNFQKLELDEDIWVPAGVELATVAVLVHRPFGDFEQATKRFTDETPVFLCT